MLADGTLGAMPPEFARPLEVLTLKLEELSALVDDLLTAARAEAGRLAFAPARFDLREAVIAAADRARPRVDLGGGTIEVATPAEAVTVLADDEHVARILDNLVNNALTYSQGPPRVRLRVQSGDFAEVRVEDGGPGVPEEMRELIFERFVRFDHPSLGPLPGTGLGLYISRELATEQGGWVGLDSTGPEGSCFVLALQPAPESEALLAGERASRTQYGASPRVS